jgi:hypothetical protein
MYRKITETEGRSPPVSSAILAKFLVSVSYTCQDAVTKGISLHGRMVHTIKNCICRAAITSRNSHITLSVPVFILSITTACNSAHSRPKASALLHIIQVTVRVCTCKTHTDCKAHCDLLSVHGVWVGENSALFRSQKLTVVHHTPSSSS